MKRIVLVLALAGASLVGLASSAAPATDVSAPMRTVLLPPIAPPPVAAPAPAPAPIAAPVSHVAPPVATTTTTTVPVAQPGPQPPSPGVVVQVPQCVVTWEVTETNPDPLTVQSSANPDPAPAAPQTTTVQDSYDGDCTTAQAVAAQHPGSTVQQTTLPETVDSADAP